MAKQNPNLVIVESPSKAKTIGKYLGPDYQVKACMGHLRDLPKSKMGVDLEHDFAPEYIPMKEKADLIRELKKAAEQADTVYLATDPDREGEAISWHIKELLQLSDDKTRRVTFNEITRGVVTKAIQQPRDIDRDLVDAQQARRILDRIVGYQLSPLLWRKIRRGLSAGRVQSVATRLVVERENEIRAFVPEEYWSLDVELACLESAEHFEAHYHGENGKKRVIATQEEAMEIRNDVEKQMFTVREIKKAEKRRSPAPPFITSTLQQDASRKLNMTPKRTMAIAQQLYEGVEITGHGAVGLITYMRTDSIRLSDEALSAAREFITERYGERYYPGSPRRYRTKNAAQDAHEAIRPSDVRLDPETVEPDLTRDQYRLYKLIWSRFVACQMENAVYDTATIETECKGHSFRSNHQSLRFSGFLAVYEEGKDDESEEKMDALPQLREGEQVRHLESRPEQHFTQPPARFTEATLVKAMEERGVGRPSTYASIVSTIQDREYVLKKDKRLEPTPLGEVVTQLMLDRFTDVIDVEFTAGMEDKLDQVEAGKINYKQVLRDFYEGFHTEMEQAEEALKDTRIKVPEEVTDEICELCGRNMVVKFGRFGKFLACPGYPECKNAKPIVEHMPGRCPKCGGGMLKRKSKRGYAYYACETGATCGFMTWDVPTDQDCPGCGQTMFKRSGKGRMKPFCINEACENFLPEDKRGYYKKAQPVQAEGEEAKSEAEQQPAVSPKASAKEKKAAAKKTATKKLEEKKTTAKKTATKKSTTKKATTGKTSAKKAAEKE
ncbi:MAG: type I DNA topoisomerase [Oscillospiraceae bacterium]|nr:type I DNA topoisomerase [Oscillospiraceae bacterium]